MPTFKPIVPTQPIVRANALKVVQQLNNYGAEAINVLGKYPPVRSGWRRTGNLGKFWAWEASLSKRAKVEGSDLVMRVGTNLPYAGRVEGLISKQPKQQSTWKNIGWPSVETVSKQKWNDYRLRIIDALHGK